MMKLINIFKIELLVFFNNYNTCILYIYYKNFLNIVLYALNNIQFNF